MKQLHYALWLFISFKSQLVTFDQSHISRVKNLQFWTNGSLKWIYILKNYRIWNALVVIFLFISLFYFTVNCLINLLHSYFHHHLIVFNFYRGTGIKVEIDFVSMVLSTFGGDLYEWKDWIEELWLITYLFMFTMNFVWNFICYNYFVDVLYVMLNWVCNKCCKILMCVWDMVRMTNCSIVW